MVSCISLLRAGLDFSRAEDETPLALPQFALDWTAMASILTAQSYRLESFKNIQPGPYTQGSRSHWC